MAKRPPPGTCVHCVKTFDELTWDHVFPQGWYPDSTPGDLEKWKFPSCDPCNGRYSKIEGDLLVLFGMCVDPTEAAAAGIAQKVLRSVDPACGRDDRDRRIRQKNRDRLLREMIPPSQIPSEGLLPGFDGGGSTPQGRSGLFIPMQSLEAMGEKFARGLAYILDGIVLSRYMKMN